MTFPFALGGALGGPSVVGFRRLLKRLLPAGYADSGALLDELECWAAMLYDAHTLIARVSSNAFVDEADELLTEWEREYALPNDAARTLEQRQARLVAAERAIGGAIRERVEDALRGVSADANWLVNLRAHIAADSLAFQPELVWQHAVQLSETEWAQPAVRRACARILQRMSAARAHFQDGTADPNEAIVCKVDAEWGSADHVIGRDALRQSETFTIENVLQRARVRQYGPLSKIRAADLNALQDAVVYKLAVDDGATVLDPFTGCQAGRVALAFSIFVATGPTTGVVDRASDWRNRLVTIWTATSGSDIRPGQAADSFVASSTMRQQVWYTGTGATDAGASASSFSVLLATDVWLYADDTTGNLKVRNLTAGSAYVVGMLHGTGPVNNVGGNPARITTFADGATFFAGGLTAAWHQAWKRAGWTRGPETSGSPVDADTWTNFPGGGGAFVLAVVPAVMPGDTVVLDALRDWTDRLLAVTCVSIQLDRWTIASTDPAWPGSSRLDQLQCAPAQVDHLTDTAHTGFTYTRLGNANGDAIAGTMVALETSARVWVDSTALSLKLTRDSGDDHTSPETYIVLVHATEQLGERSTPDLLAFLTTSDGNPIHPQELDQPQDRSLCVQAGGYPSVPEAATSNLPLGPKATPVTPTIPETWPTRDIALELPETLQPVAGWVRAFFSGLVPADQAELVIDTRDWRDRFVWAQVAWSSTTDRHVGGADPGAINATSGTTRHSTARYTGDGAATIWDVTGSNPYSAALDATGYALRLTSTEDADVVLLYARESDGALCIASTDVIDEAVTVMVEGSFQLGTRKTA